MQIKPTQIHPMSAFCHIRRSFKRADVLCHTCGCLSRNVRSSDTSRPFVFHSHFIPLGPKGPKVHPYTPSPRKFSRFRGFFTRFRFTKVHKNSYNIQTPPCDRFIGSSSDSSGPFSPPVAAQWPCPKSAWRY